MASRTRIVEIVRLPNRRYGWRFCGFDQWGVYYAPAGGGAA